MEFSQYPAFPSDTRSLAPHPWSLFHASLIMIRGQWRISTRARESQKPFSAKLYSSSPQPLFDLFVLKRVSGHEKSEGQKCRYTADESSGGQRLLSLPFFLFISRMEMATLEQKRPICPWRLSKGEPFFHLILSHTDVSPSFFSEKPVFIAQSNLSLVWYLQGAAAKISKFLFPYFDEK